MRKGFVEYQDIGLVLTGARHFAASSSGMSLSLTGARTTGPSTSGPRRNCWNAETVAALISLNAESVPNFVAS